MSPRAIDEVRRLFDLAVECAAEQRTAVLDRECSGDRVLRQRVEAMLAAAENAPSVAESPSAAPTVVEAQLERPGARIGPYKLLQLIGEGGFGSVFMAEQERPVVRKVALKIIKLGMDTRQVIARFEAERQALALMDHPHIARVLDAGATDVGRPFFVMELVKGEPIVEYCDRQRLEIEERLRLFAQVCSAVQHAHTKGIIHRDIKPSNILVSTQDGRPFAKVIDFGIAKATSARLTAKTLFTEHRQLVGTPEYMSPEQAEGSLDLDTRTDVYSLGVLLYELLTGTTPFDSRALRSAAYAEMQRMIREVDPPPPSTRVSRNTETIAGVAALRHTEPKKLGARIRGELDWIVMKALEKDRARRYETASALASDVERHLGGRTVVAAPPSRAYRARKFILRNRAGVTAAALVSLALVLGIVGTTWGMILAGRQRALAQESARNAIAEATRAAVAEQRAQRRSQELEQVARFQAEQLGAVDASVMGVGVRADVLNKVRETAARARLDEAAAAARVRQVEQLIAGADFTGLARGALERQFFKPTLAAIDQQFAEQPLVRARLLQSLADAALRLDLNQFTIAPQQQALEIRRRVLGDDDPATIESIRAAASLEMRLGRRAESERLHREALERTRRVHGEDSRQYVQALSGLAMELDKQSQDAEADELRAQAYEFARRVLGEDDETTQDVKTGVAVALMFNGHDKEAEPIFREIVEAARRRHPPDSNELAGPERWLGICLGKLGRGEEGEPYQRHALELNRRYLGDDHATTMSALNMLGWLHRQLGRYEEAEHELTEAYERRRRVFGDDHQDTLASQRNLGQLALERRRFDEAESFSRQALEGMRRNLGNRHMDTVWAAVNLGKALVGQNRLDEAELYLREAAVASDDFSGSVGNVSFAATLALAELLATEEKFGDGVQLLEAARDRCLAGSRSGQDPPDAGRARRVARELANLYDRWNSAQPGQGHDAQAAEWRARSD